MLNPMYHNGEILPMMLTAVPVAVRRVRHWLRRRK
jgi:hypothetical protein